MSVSVTMLTAQLTGVPYPPPGVPDTAENKRLWEAIAADVAEMSVRGVVPEVPYEYADDEDGREPGGVHHGSVRDAG